MEESRGEREAERRDGRRRVAVKPVVALVAAGLFSAIALAVIIGLTLHAKSTREHDDTIDELVSQLNELQGVPWRFQTTGAASSGAAAARALRVSMLDSEQHILRTLGDLRREAPVPGLRAAAGPLANNFATLNKTVELVAHRKYAAAGLLAPATFQTHDAVVAALDRAFSHYRSQTSTAELEAALGAVAAVMLLLGGFALFYLRAYKAQASSQQLANELRRSQAHLEVAQHLAGVGSWEWDPDGERLTFSAEHARLHDWTSPAPPRDAAAILELIAPDDRERVAEALAAAAQSSVPIDFDYRVREANGGRLIHVTAVSVTGADGRRRMIGTSQDVTERVKRVEAERANRAKDEFISRMSHELRTPLNAVLGFGQLLTMSDLDERQQANVEHILSAGRHLLDLINEILDISRIESGDLRLSLEPVSVRGMIADGIDLVTPAADPRSITVTAQLPPDDMWVRADVQRLRQVLLNLLSNAVKYNRDGGHVHVYAAVEPDGRAAITVRDDGPGIAPELVDRLFSPFERLGAEQSTVEGTGLGLAVSRGMIEAMGGRISMRSEPGNGSAFTIELDVEEAPRSGIDPSNGAGTAAAPLHPPRKVLCVEDNVSNLSLIEQILAERPNVEMLSATNGENGVALARERTPDLILLDLSLPDVGGEEVLTRLKRDPLTRGTPVVVVSADVSAHQLEHVLELGAGSCLSKPVDVKKLLHFVDHPREAMGSST